MLLAVVADGGEAGPLPSGQDQTPRAAFGARQSLELAHEEGVGKPMKSRNAERFWRRTAPRDGQKLATRGMSRWKASIEARHLWQSR